MNDSSPASRLSRRELLRVGGLGTIGISLPQLLASRASTAETLISGLAPKADACITLFLNGGPSHLDMWDMKPASPVEIRGEFNPITTSLSGVNVCEHLPMMAKQMHRTTLIRSMNHSVNNSHAAAVYAALTGHDRGEQGGGAKPDDHPSPGSVLAKLRPTPAGSLPYITLPYKTKEGAGGPLQPGFLAGFMGATYDPFWVLDNPNTPNFHVRNLTLPEGLALDRMQARRSLLSSLDRGLRVKSNQTLDSLDDFQSQAFDLLTSNRAQRAFKLDEEPASVRDSYGRNIYGQSVLLARRLIEAKTRMVTMSWAPNANATWDTHGQNFKSLKTNLLPQFDAACSNLIEDLAQRGLLERTLVAVLGDFGRSPKINNNAGRDHWNSCYSIMLVGGGVKAGLVYGESDRSGAVPTQSPVSPGDIIATIYQLLGVSHDHMLYDKLNRPHTVVPEARIIHELLA